MDRQRGMHFPSHPPCFSCLASHCDLSPTSPVTHVQVLFKQNSNAMPYYTYQVLQFRVMFQALFFVLAIGLSKCLFGQPPNVTGNLSLTLEPAAYPTP
jgi:hypothetical protein